MKQEEEAKKTNSGQGA